MALSFTNLQRRDYTCQLSGGAGRSLRVDTMSVRSQPVHCSQLERISNNLGRLCRELDIRDTEEESDQWEEQKAQDLNLKTSMPIVLASKTFTQVKKLSMPISRTMYATPEK